MATRRPTIYERVQTALRKIGRAAQRIAKRGYIFDLPFGKTKQGKEKKRYTQKEAEYLEGIKSKDLYPYSTVNGMSGVEYRKYERSQAAKRGYETRLWKKKHSEFDARRYFVEERQQREELVSISRTVIDNAMQRSNWRWNDEYYEKFLAAVEKAKAISLHQTAQAFQDMINDNVLIPIQKDYRPEDFWVDYATFTDYFADIKEDFDEIIHFTSNSEMENEDNDGFEKDKEDAINEIWGQ